MSNWEKRNYPESHPNKHIADYLDFYLNLKKPGYAVLIGGEWGCGKTFFIEEYFKKDESVIYSSLYGQTSVGTIEDYVYFQSYQKFGGKSAMLAGSVMNSIVKAITDIDVKAEMANATEEVKRVQSVLERAAMRYEELEKKVVVFDDFERSLIEPCLLLGYVNLLVEHLGVRVIICGKEAEIDEQSCDKNKYGRIKEKTIGKTFSVTPDLADFLNVYIDSVAREDSRLGAFFRICDDNIKRIFYKSKYNNLRILRQALIEYKSFRDRMFKIPELAVRGLVDEASVLLLEFYLALYMEIVTGELDGKEYKLLNNSEEDFRKEMIGKSLTIDNNEKKVGTIFTQKMSKYFGEYDTYYIAPKSLYRMFCGEYISDTEFRQQILESNYWAFRLNDSIVELFRRTKNLRYYSDEAMDANISELVNATKDGKFTHPMDYLLAVNYFLLFRKWKMENVPDRVIIERCKKGIDNAVLEKTAAQHFSYNHNSYHESWRGIGLEFRTERTFVKVANYLNKKCDKLTVEWMHQNSMDVLESMKDGFDKYEELLDRISNENEAMRSYPYHKDMNPEEVFDVIIKWKNSDLVGFYYFVKDLVDYSHKQKNEEIEYWKGLKRCLEKQNAENTIRKLSGKIIEDIANKIGDMRILKDGKQ